LSVGTPKDIYKDRVYCRFYHMDLLTMQPSIIFKKLLQYVTLAATTAQEIADISQVPFLVSIAALTSSIVKCVEASHPLFLMRRDLSGTDCSFEQG
jgi:hypothetical protein